MLSLEELRGGYGFCMLLCSEHSNRERGDAEPVFFKALVNLVEKVFLTWATLIKLTIPN